MSKDTNKINEAASITNANKKQQEKLYKTIKDSGGDIGMRVRAGEKTKEDKMPNAIFMDNPWGSSRTIDTYSSFQVRNEAYEDWNIQEEESIPSSHKPNLWSVEEIEAAKEMYRKDGIDATGLNNEEFEIMMADYENTLMKNNDTLSEDVGLPTAKGAKQMKSFMKKATKGKKKGKKEKGVKDLTGAKIATYESWKGAFKGMDNPTRLEDFYKWLDRDKIDLNDDSWVRGTEEDFLRPMFKNLPNHKDRFPYDVLRDGRFLETKDGKIVAQINKLKGKVIILDIIDEDDKHKYVEYDLVKILKKIKDRELKINSNETSKNIKIDTPWGKVTQKENE